MGIKRLLFGQTENPYPGDIRYSPAEDTLMAESGIYHAFTLGEEAFSEDEVFMEMETEKYYRMGWNTMAVFEKTENGFKVINRHDPTSQSEKNKNDAIDGEEFRQIATQAVETCTLVYVETECQCYFAHFLDTRLNDFMEYLKKVLPVQTIKTFFCSLLTTKNSENSDWINGYRTMLSFKDKAETFLLFDRGPINDCYLTHMEFGIGMDDSKQVTYFGDVSCSTPEIRDTEKKQCCCSLFSFHEIKDLDSLNDMGNNVLAKEMGNS